MPRPLPKTYIGWCTACGRDVVKYKSSRNCVECRSKKRVAWKQAWLEWLHTNYDLKCNRCGFSTFAAMQFHHVDPNKKEFTISPLVNGQYALNDRNIERVKHEIDKCEILCANCHMIEHYS